MSTVPAVEFVRVSKSWGPARAVIDVSLAIQPGEFFSLLGPSGCGKTTTLRLLAGFETPDPDGGEVRLRGKVVNQLRPYDRDLGMVFQSYALFPHLSVARNVAFGLEQRGVPRGEIGPRVTRALEMVRLDPAVFADRMPPQLSGGQRQRVALARALVIEPPILLLDEPLGALDLQLRKEMQLEMKELNRRLGITFVYVTHDQEEALTMSDRIAVMSQARVAQLGTPAEIYERPRTEFVAKFIGASSFVDGAVVASGGGRLSLRHAGGGSFETPADGQPSAGTALRISVRPERVSVLPVDATPPGNALPGKIRAVIYRGEMLHVRVDLQGGGEVIAGLHNPGSLHNPVRWQAGDAVLAAWAPEDGRLVAADPS